MKQINKILLFLLCLTIGCNVIYAKQKTGHLEKDPTYDKYQSLSDDEKLEYIEPLEYIYVDDPLVDESTSDLADVDFYLSASYTDSSYDYDASYPLKDYKYSGSTESSSSKNQNPLNVCWAFAMNNAIESYLAKHGMTDNGKKYNLSEIYLEYVSYLNIFNNKIPTDDRRGYNIGNYQFGGSNSPAEVTRYITYGYAPITESQFGSAYSTTYQSGKDPTTSAGKAVTGNFNKVDLDVTGLRVYNGRSFDYIMDIKEQIFQNGAIYTGFYVDPNAATFGSSQYDSSANFVYNSSNPGPNHAVTIVGWDNNKKSTKFNKTGAWIAVNSWGDTARKFYISYDDQSLMQAFLGLTEVKEKSWTNAYEPSTYTRNGATTKYEFHIDKAGELLHSVKIMGMGLNSEGGNIFKSTTVTAGNKNITKTLNQGIVTFDYSDSFTSLGSTTIYVTVNQYIEGDAANKKDINDIILYTSTPVKYSGSYPAAHDYVIVDPGTTATTFKNNVQPASGVSKGNVVGAVNSKVATRSYVEVSYTGKSTYNNQAYDTVTKKIFAVVKGDVNGDGEVKSNDCLIIKKHIMGKSTIGDRLYFAAGDYDSNNEIKSYDYLQAKKTVMGKQ